MVNQIKINKLIDDAGNRYTQSKHYTFNYENVRKCTDIINTNSRMEDHHIINNDHENDQIVWVCISDGHSSQPIHPNYHYGGYECSVVANESLNSHIEKYHNKVKPLNLCSTDEIYAMLKYGFTYAHQNIIEQVYQNITDKIAKVMYPKYFNNAKLLDFINKQFSISKIHCLHDLKSAQRENIYVRFYNVNFYKNYSKDDIISHCIYGHKLPHKTFQDKWKVMDMGCTTTVVLKVGNYIYCANAGDSEAVIWQPQNKICVPLSTKHCIKTETELHRMKKNCNHKTSKGVYTVIDFKTLEKSYLDSSCHDDKQKEWIFKNLQLQPTNKLKKKHREAILQNRNNSVMTNYLNSMSKRYTLKINYGLMPTRSIGHAISYYYGVTCKPSINYIVCNEPMCIIIATDGLYDYLSYNDCMRCKTEEDLVKMYNKKSKNKKRDNIIAICMNIY